MSTGRATLLWVLFLLPLVAVQPAAAEETQASSYALPPAVFYHRGIAVGVCPAGCDLVGDEAAEVPPVGAKRGFVPAAPATTVSISFEDENHGGDVAYSICINPDGLLCRHHLTECGPLAFGIQPPVHRIDVHIYLIAVLDDMRLCGATAGTVTVVFDGSLPTPQ